MKHSHGRATLGTALGLLMAATGACSSSSTPAGPGTTPGGTGGTSGGPGTTPAAGTCTKSQIEILFSPMYSAYDGVHRFQVPAVVNGIDNAAITWSASDPTMVDLQPNEDGVMITVQKAGTVTIVASAGTLCGSSLLTITPATPMTG